jgi:hypothetical protein
MSASAASAFAAWSASVAPPARWGITAKARSGTPRTRAATRAAFSNVSHTTVTVCTPIFSNAAASSTLPDVQDPHKPMPTTATRDFAA